MILLPWTSDSILLSRALALAANLTHLGLYCVENVTIRWNTRPAVFKNAFYEALQLPSFPILALMGCTDADVLEIESLISRTSRLRELTLEAINFENMAARRGDPAPVVLDSLTLTTNGPTVVVDHAVHAMLSSFRIVNITHLRFLELDNGSASIPLLKANGRTVEKIRYSPDLAACECNLYSPHMRC